MKIYHLATLERVLQVKLVTAPWRPTVTIFLDSVEEYDVPFF
jgi:hypothetical protein